MWGYAALAGAMGTVEAFWWGGKGWFMPAFGTIILLFGAAPSNWMTQKLFRYRHMTPPSFRGLFAIGLLQGLSMFPTIDLVSSFVKFALTLRSIAVHGLAELFVIAVNVLMGIAISALVSALAISWLLNSKASLK